MNLYLRLSKQDVAERPDPLYVLLSTQPRFTKRYSELLTAAGEGKGLSQVRTYGSENDYTTINDNTSCPLLQNTQQEDVQNNNASSAESLAASMTEVPEPSSNNAKTTSSQQSSDQDPTSPNEDGHPKVVEGAKDIEVTRNDHDSDQKLIGQTDAKEGAPTLENDEGVEEDGNVGVSLINSVPDNSQRDHITTEQQVEPCTDEKLTTTREDTVKRIDAEVAAEELVAESQRIQNTGKCYYVKGVIDSVTIETTADSHPSENSPGDEEVGSFGEHEQGPHIGDKGVVGNNSPKFKDTGNGGVHTAGIHTLAPTEVLQEYEEEDEASSFSEIPVGNGTAQQDSVLDVNDTGDDVPTQFDDESFSSATIVGVSDAQSPCEYEASPGLDTTETKSPQVDVEQHQIQVYQFDENSPDYDNTEEQKHLGADDLEPYEYEEAENLWEGDSGEFLQDESYYTAGLEQDGYTNAEHGDETSAVHDLREEVPSGATYDDHGYNKRSEQIFDPPYDVGLYEEYPEVLPIGGVMREGRSPSGKRFREEEGDVPHVQGKCDKFPSPVSPLTHCVDTKRTRSS